MSCSFISVVATWSTVTSLCYCFSDTTTAASVVENGNQIREEHRPQESLWCPPPDIKVGGAIITTSDGNEEGTFDGGTDDARVAESFAHATEVRFPGQVGPLGDRRPCKIKCISGQWLGPLCATNEDGDRFQPLFRSCRLDRWHNHLVLSFKNITVSSTEWQFPHGSELLARCSILGLYKLTGEHVIRCVNGDWSTRMPSCVPTNKLTNYSEDSPPAVLPRLLSGSASFEPSGALAVFPGSSLLLECLHPRSHGAPEWTWSAKFTQYITGWSVTPADRDLKYRLSLRDVTPQDTGTFTCTTPRGVTHSLHIVIVSVHCQSLPPEQYPLEVRVEGSRLGQRAMYTCPRGYRLHGVANSTCQASGTWSSPPPTCVPVLCPELLIDDPHLTMVEYNASAGGRAVFRCSWGYRLSGPPGLECEREGVWSGPIPQCKAIQCPPPLVPLNGRIEHGGSDSTATSRYAVGALVQFGCNERHTLVGEASIVCTETGFWSHPPPFCKSQCPYPGDPEFGLLAPLKFSYDPGDTLQVECRPGYVVRLVSERPTCQTDGQWSHHVPQCTPYDQV